MLCRIAQGTALLAAMVFLAVPGWITTHSTDLSDPGDADLLTLHARPATSVQGYADLAAASAAIDGVLDTQEAHERLGSIDLERSEDVAWLQDHLAATAEARSAVERAVRAPGWRAPPLDGPDDIAWFPEFFAIQRIAKLETLAGRLDLRSGGDPAEALERILLGQRAAHAAAEAGELNLLAMAFALSFQAVSLNALERAAAAGEIPVENQVALIARLESLRVGPDAWRRVWAGEYAFFRRIVTAAVEEELSTVLPEGFPDTVQGWLPLDYLWQPNRTLAAMAERYRGYQETSALDCQTVVDRPRVEAPPTWRLVLGSNSIGRIMFHVADSDVTRFEVRRCHLETRASLLQAALAVRVHVARTGERPSSLAELVPDLLPHVPMDAYTGEPVVFSPETGEVRSNGAELASREKSLDPAELSLSL